MNEKQVIKSFLPPVLIITGPTASGKTDLAMQLAQEMPIEIVSVDSALIYKGMDIGTAKPTKQERAIVKHHLIDILNPEEAYSVASFRHDAITCIQDILKKDKLPVLVGGTMLYFKILLNGITPLPAADPAIREKILKSADKQGWAFVHQQLIEVDPISASTIKPTDTQRLQRALEVHMLTSKPLSMWHREHKEKTKHISNFLPFNVISFAIMPANRYNLHQRISTRFNNMIDAGFINEVEGLYCNPKLSIGLPSMRSVGYRQIWEYLAGITSKQQSIEKAIAATRQLAKRQMTWLRSWKGCNIMNDLVVSDIINLVTKHQKQHNQ